MGLALTIGAQAQGRGLKDCLSNFVSNAIAIYQENNLSQKPIEQPQGPLSPVPTAASRNSLIAQVRAKDQAGTLWTVEPATDLAQTLKVAASVAGDLGLNTLQPRQIAAPSGFLMAGAQTRGRVILQRALPQSGRSRDWSRTSITAHDQYGGAFGESKTTSSGGRC